MFKNVFRKWLDSESNQFFWQEALPSERFDELLSDKRIQRSISSSKRNQSLYSFLDNNIAENYALLIDIKLREAFIKLTRDEFRVPSGFEKKDRASFRQQNYFMVRDYLEFFLKQDIKQHNHPDAQLNAFRRWIDVSIILLNRHCYEGFLLVCVNVQLLATPQLINGLPEGVRNTYNRLSELTSPHKNHNSLRNFIRRNQREDDFPPLLFIYHAITVLNASMEKLKHNEQTLKNSLKQIEMKRANAGDEHTEESVDLQKQKSSCSHQLKHISKNIRHQLHQRSMLLNEMESAQKTQYKALPAHMQQSYRRVQVRYNRFQIAQEMDKVTHESNTIDREAPSSLYRKGLLPSFWSRKGLPAEGYWSRVFAPRGV